VEGRGKNSSGEKLETEEALKYGRRLLGGLEGALRFEKGLGMGGREGESSRPGSVDFEDAGKNSAARQRVGK